VLELGNPSQALKTHVDSDDLQKMEVIDNLGRAQRANHVSEYGLYALITMPTWRASQPVWWWWEPTPSNPSPASKGLVLAGVIRG
jgi:hypothetical protein